MPITLYIVRHAQAEDRAMFLTDHERQLTPNGMIAAARMGRHLSRQSIMPDVIISSTAARAKATATVLAEQMHYDTEQIQVDERLFEGGPKAYLAAINSLPNAPQSAMIVGHNPDVSYLAEFLTHKPIGDMDTGTVVAVSFENLNWAEVSGRTGSVVFVTSPKQLPNES